VGFFIDWPWSQLVATGQSISLLARGAAHQMRIRAAG
jgi:hypothetical protein